MSMEVINESPRLADMTHHAPTLRSTDGPSSTADTGVGWLWLSAPLAGLGAIAAAAGILFNSTYERDAENFATQAKSQDYITLFVAVPVLLMLWRRAANGSLPARFMWHGVVFYFAYTYTIAAFMVRFNNLFLVYTSAMACSAFAILSDLGKLTPNLQPRLFDAVRWPRRAVIAMLATIVVVFTALWLADIVPALLDGTEPESLGESATPTNGVEVIDLSLLLPGAAVIASMVWRSTARGYMLATALVTYIALLGTALVAMVIGQYNADLIDSPAPALFFAVLVAAALRLLHQMVRATRSVTRSSSASRG